MPIAHAQQLSSAPKQPPIHSQQNAPNAPKPQRIIENGQAKAYASPRDELQHVHHEANYFFGNIDHTRKFMQITLSTAEMEVLFRQDSRTRRDGGFQSFLVRLQKKTDLTTEALLLSASDLETIPRYAFKYGNGGWENRLKSIFEQQLGSELGRE